MLLKNQQFLNLLNHLKLVNYMKTNAKNIKYYLDENMKGY